jgi:type VI secretion system protein ImpE
MLDVDITPENMLKEGRLDDALQGLTARVRGNPADAKARVFLFQLLALPGQWERAHNQLKVSGELDPLNILMVGAYEHALRGERERADAFSGKRQPTVIGEPEPWLALLLQSLKLAAEQHYAPALSLREQAFEQAEAVGGQIDGEPFEWIADADPRFGPCLEIILNGGYAWVPFARIAQLDFEQPSDLRDKVWTPVRVTWSNGGEAMGFVPTRYPGSEQSADPDAVLARKTDWIEVGGGFFAGCGQRMFATDAGEYPLLDTRRIVFGAA